MSDKAAKETLPLQAQLGFPHDHAEIAWNHFLAQHIGKSNTEGFVRGFYEPLKVLDKALNDLYTKRNLDTAEGAQLDGIGSIVGLSRYSPIPIYLEFFGFDTQPAGRAFGVAPMRKFHEPYTVTDQFPDEQYRIAIQCKIALNNGHGTAEEIIEFFNSVFQVSATIVYDRRNAHGSLVINKPIAPTDPAYYHIHDMIPGAAGVKWDITTSERQLIFGFDAYGRYYGFGVGVMAHRVVKAEGVANAVF